MQAAIRNYGSGDKAAGTWRHRKKNGTLMQVAVRSADVDFAGWPARLVLAEDITERAHLEEQLRQVAAAGSHRPLTGGVAHDFNNLLTVLMGVPATLAPHLPEAGGSNGRRWSTYRTAELGAEWCAAYPPSPHQPLVADTTECIDLGDVVRPMEEHSLRGCLGRTDPVGGPGRRCPAPPTGSDWSRCYSISASTPATPCRRAATVLCTRPA